MPDWPIHIIVPLLALLIISRKEDQKFILLLIPLSVIPDIDTIVSQHRALLHNMFIPILLIIPAFIFKKRRSLFLIAAIYLSSHIFLDMFQGGVALFYPFDPEMFFVDATLNVSQANELTWNFKYGLVKYSPGWKIAYGYISDSPGTGAMTFIILASLYAAYRKWGTK